MSLIGVARQVPARTGQARQGEAWLVKDRLGTARRGRARLGAARLGNHKQEKTMASVKINRHTDVIKREVVLCGTKDAMFDRYPGDNGTKLEPHQKLYLQPGASPVIGLPSTNIMSFLSAHNTNSAPKRLRDKRKFKDIANAALSFVDIEQTFIPFLRDGKPIVFGALGQNEVDAESGVYVHRSVARLDKGIPNPKVRPVLPLPWSLAFTLTLFPNKEIQEQEILNLFEDGGRALGIGTFRGVFGKFFVEKWE